MPTRPIPPRKDQRWGYDPQPGDLGYTMGSMGGYLRMEGDVPSGHAGAANAENFAWAAKGAVESAIQSQDESLKIPARLGNLRLASGGLHLYRRGTHDIEHGGDAAQRVADRRGAGRGEAAGRDQARAAAGSRGAPNRGDGAVAGPGFHGGHDPGSPREGRVAIAAETVAGVSDGGGGFAGAGAAFGGGGSEGGGAGGDLEPASGGEVSAHRFEDEEGVRVRDVAEVSGLPEEAVVAQVRQIRGEAGLRPPAATRPSALPWIAGGVVAGGARGDRLASASGVFRRVSASGRRERSAESADLHAHGNLNERRGDASARIERGGDRSGEGVHRLLGVRGREAGDPLPDGGGPSHEVHGGAGAGVERRGSGDDARSAAGTRYMSFSGETVEPRPGFARVSLYGWAGVASAWVARPLTAEGEVQLRALAQRLLAGDEEGPGRGAGDSAGHARRRPGAAAGILDPVRGASVRLPRGTAASRSRTCRWRRWRVGWRRRS